MNPDEIFDQWKQHRRDVSVSEDFADGVMARVNLRTEPHAESHTPRWLAAAVILVAVGSAAIHLAIVLFFTLTALSEGT